MFGWWYFGCGRLFLGVSTFSVRFHQGRLHCSPITLSAAVILKFVYTPYCSALQCRVVNLHAPGTLTRKTPRVLTSTN